MAEFATVEQLEVLKKISVMPDEEIDRLYSECSDIDLDYNRNPFYYWTPHPTQRRFLESKKRIKVLFGGNQAGKTTTSAYEVIKDCVDNAAHHWWAGAETWEVSRLTQQAKYNEMLPLDEVEYGLYNPENGFKNNIIRFKNGSTISFRSYDQERKRWQGATLNGIALDEEPPWDIFQECKARVLKASGPILITMTALSGFTRLVEHLMNKQDENVEVFFISSYENTKENGGALDRGTLEEMERSLDDDDANARLHGIPVIKGGLVFKDFKNAPPCVIPHEREFAVNEKWPTIVSLDPHTKIPNVALWVQLDMQGHLWVTKEIGWLNTPDKAGTREWNTLKQYAAEVCKYNRSYYIDAVIIDKYGGNKKDAVAQTSIRQELINNGLYTLDAGGDVDAKIMLTQQLFRQARIHIFESCWNLTWELSRYQWDTHLTQKLADRKEEKQTPRKKFDHLIDCLMNAVLHLSQNGAFVLPADKFTMARNPANRETIEKAQLHTANTYDNEPILMEMYE